MARKYELPAFLVGTVTQEQYERWLLHKARAHVRRDRKRGNPSATNEEYKIEIHRAVIESEGRGPVSRAPECGTEGRGWEQEYIAELHRHASATRELLSNPKKPERERMVVRAFLRCVGVQFSDDEIEASSNEPVDVVFRAARFQIMEILGSRKRGLAWREREERYMNAKQISDVEERWTPSKPMSFGEVSQMITTDLAMKASRYGVDSCSKLDALVYVDLRGRHLWPLESTLEAKVSDALSQQGWRSVSMLFLPYGIVFTAKPDAPEFLKDNAGVVLNEWRFTDGWFDV